MSQRLLTTGEASAFLGVSKQFLERDRWLHPNDPRIPFIRIGERAIRYEQEILEQYIKNQTTGNLKTLL